MKRQEKFCFEVQKYCPNVRIALGVGSSFDYFTGFQKRAPKIFRDIGFEWFYRIFTSPNKLDRLRRMYQAVIVFPMKVILYNK
jgi:N-acetylglucosaminyldiphosphoundecaprenol N-acetyl-beta-D-mannosaminyltransferase